jgi:7 transmembrane receptor (rhodopsin family).
MLRPEMFQGVCKTAFFPPRNPDNTKDIILLLLNGIIAILNFTLNLVVVYMIFKTRQYRNNSIKLFLVLSLSDIMTAIVSQPFIVYLLYGNTLSCGVSIFLQYLCFFFPYFSVFMIAFIVYDRFLRITYLNKYKLYMTHNKFAIGFVLVVSATTFQDIIITVATTNESPKFGGVGVLPLNLVTLAFEIVTYTKTIYKLKQYKEERKQKFNNMVTAENSFTRLAAAYLLMILIFFTPFMIINTLYSLYPRADLNGSLDLQYVWLHTQILYCFNSFANAVIFLRVNRKARVTLKLSIQRCLKSRLEPVGHLSSQKNNPYYLGMSTLKREKSRCSDHNNNSIYIRRESTSL